jgi:dipeptidyl aminopeptidase/acylaminoacyl peptidase
VLALAAGAAMVLMAVPSGGALTAQRAHDDSAAVTSANYRLAARFAPYKMRKLVYSTSVTPRWIEGTSKFWYEWESSDGKRFMIVDPAAATKRQIFDNDRIAAELTRITRDPWDGRHLPIRSIRFIDGNTLEFEVESSQDEEVKDAEAERGNTQDSVRQRNGARRPRPKKKVWHFRYDLTSQTLSEIPDWQAPDNHPSWASVSPDGQTVVYGRHHNLYMMTGAEYRKVLDARRGKSGAAADSADWKVVTEEVQLTTNGEEDYSWAFDDRNESVDEAEKSRDRRKRAGITWSRDSKRFTAQRQDQRKVGDLWVIRSTGNKRPQLESYKYDMPGDTSVSQPEVGVYDLAARQMVMIQARGYKDQEMGLFNAREFTYPDSDEPRRSLWLSPNSDEVWLWRRSRDQHKVDVLAANATTGAVRVVIEERLNTYVEHQRLELLASGDLLWWSERDGWAHLYRFGPDGTLRNRLTEGPFSVGGIEGIDESRGIVYFTAHGREQGEDPYFAHLYRVGLDGRGLTLLDGGDFDHRASLDESNRWFVHNYSRVNTIPAAALHDAATGRKLLDLEVADFSRLQEAGYQFPQPFTVKADDGVTDLYGVMYRPFDFDSTKRYPIVEYVYPGPQTESVAKSFSTSASEAALAQFGFVVITVGNRGGHPDRSKWYHNYGYGNLRDYGLADKKAAAEQLADRYDWIDIDRVGIYGHSGGGFMSTAAMLVYPDFFKVAVSSSGNHENNIYNQNWSEKHHGVKEVVKGDSITFEYDIAKNSELAKNLKGHLLLTTGDMDNNVHPGNTIRMAEALIKANKRFDFFIFPGQRHGYGNMSDYWFWLRAEYFVRHLLGDDRWNASIAELDVEREQTR